MSDMTLVIDGTRVPRLFYGTAWKEERTQHLTERALHAGFRGVDTANQRRHYVETAVGNAVRTSLGSGLLKRDELFLQTKFTFRRGQDHRLPYDRNAPISEQVPQSFANSLEHLDVTRIDSYLLHGPSQRVGLGADDWDAWRAMEAIYDSGQVQFLGISNVSVDQLRLLHAQSRIKSRFVQNRCFADTSWDRETRAFCAANQLMYQAFSLLTANTIAINRPPVVAIAKRHERTIPQIVFRFALQCGMIALTGTTSADHMRADLDILNFELSANEVSQIERITMR